MSSQTSVDIGTYFFSNIYCPCRITKLSIQGMNPMVNMCPCILDQGMERSYVILTFSPQPTPEATDSFHLCNVFPDL